MRISKKMRRVWTVVVVISSLAIVATPFLSIFLR